VEGLKNRLVIIVQIVVKARDRHTICEMARKVDEVQQALRPVEQPWGVKVREYGFSTFSPMPETLEGPAALPVVAFVFNTGPVRGEFVVPASQGPTPSCRRRGLGCGFATR
jgi:hypothetical protein